MPMINIEDSYILDETGAEVDKVTGLFTKDEGTTSGEKAFAQLNIGTAGSNRNLLDNPWFTVNQRSATSGSGTAASYIADRWTVTYGNGGVTWSRTDDTITIASTNGTSHGDIAQRMEKSLFDYLVGKTVTVSVMLEDYSIVSRPVTFNSGSAPTIGHDLDGNAIIFRPSQSSTYQDVQIWKYNTAGTFRAVKLELGSVSTLANDAPPDYEDELRKCKQYFRRLKVTSRSVLGLAYGYANTGAEMPNLFGVGNEMRTTTPNVSFSGSIVLKAASTEYAVTAISKNVGSTNFSLSFASSGLTAGTVYRVVGGADAYIDISADL